MDYLTKSEFYEYMSEFGVKLENRLATLETKISNGGGKGGREGLIGILKYIFAVVVGGFLALGGASWGQNLFK